MTLHPPSPGLSWLSLAIVLSPLALLCTSCASDPPPPRNEPPPPRSEPPQETRPTEDFGPVLDGYKQGVADALREIKAGRETLTTAGLNQSTTRTADGLPIRPVETDAIDAPTLMRIIGHNDTIRLWKGLPADPTPP